MHAHVLSFRDYTSQYLTYRNTCARTCKLPITSLLHKTMCTRMATAELLVMVKKKKSHQMSSNKKYYKMQYYA